MKQDDVIQSSRVTRLSHPNFLYSFTMWCSATSYVKWRRRWSYLERSHDLHVDILEDGIFLKRDNMKWHVLVFEYHSTRLVPSNPITEGYRKRFPVRSLNPSMHHLSGSVRAWFDCLDSLGQNNSVSSCSRTCRMDRQAEAECKH